MPERIWGFSKIVSFKTNNVNAQILGFLLNVLSSYAKIRVPDPLLVYGIIMSEIIRIARCTLLLDDLIPRLGALCRRMLNQGADCWKILRQCKRAMDKHSHSFVKFASRSDIIIEKLLQELI